jgi:hypothetical protein
MMTGGEGCKDYDPKKPEHCPGQASGYIGRRLVPCVCSAVTFALT